MTNNDLETSLAIAKIIRSDLHWRIINDEVCNSYGENKTIFSYKGYDSMGRMVEWYRTYLQKKYKEKDMFFNTMCINFVKDTADNNSLSVAILKVNNIDILRRCVAI